MVRSILVLPDGTRLSSGAPGAAIVSVYLKRQCNPDRNLMPGGVIPAMLRCELTEAAGVKIDPGDRLELYFQEEDREESQGVFYTGQPEKTSTGSMTLTAYDPLRLLEKDLTRWLAGLTEWPVSLLTFAQMVCRECGLELSNKTLPNGNCPVRQFSGRGITGRELMEFVCQATGKFCRANKEGKVELFWYSNTAEVTLTEADPEGMAQYYNTDLSLRIWAMDHSGEQGAVTVNAPPLGVTDNGEGDVAVKFGGPRKNYPIFKGTFRRGDYQVKPPDQVLLRADEKDPGLGWPEGEPGENVCVITGNPLLTACTAQELRPVAQVLYELMQFARYTPCTMEIPANTRVRPGDILKVIDLTGIQHTVCVMTTEIKGQRMTVTCTGDPVRSQSDSVNSIQALRGKILKLQADVDGLSVLNADSQGNAASMEMETDNLRTELSRQKQTLQGLQQQLTLLTQTAREVQLQITSMTENGAETVRTTTGYTFDETGLRISRSGQQMDNLLDHTGMYVQRGKKMILQANHEGVEAVDVSVGNYLIVGDHARIQDFSNGSDSRRTGCFYIS